MQKPSLEKDVYMYRAYIARGQYRIVIDEIKQSNDTPLLALRYYAEYLLHSSSGANANKSKLSTIIQYFDDKFSKDDINDIDCLWIITGASIYYNENMIDSALKLVYLHRYKNKPEIYHDILFRILFEIDNLECLALQIQCLLRINRLDIAKKTLQTMQEKDDDATLTQLALSWYNIRLGGEKLQDAYYVQQDFCDKYNSTVKLLIGQAVSYLGQEKYEEAESILRECLERDPNNYDTLINLIFLSQQTDKNLEVRLLYF